jgi:hypothetical protein
MGLLTCKTFIVILVEAITLELKITLIEVVDRILQLDITAEVVREQLERVVLMEI